MNQSTYSPDPRHRNSQRSDLQSNDAQSNDLRSYAGRHEGQNKGQNSSLDTFRPVDKGYCTIEVLFDQNNEPTDFRFLDTNSAFVLHTGLENVVGKTAREVVPGLESLWVEIYGSVALTGREFRAENFSGAMDRWFDVYAFRVGAPHEHQVGIYFKDITQRKLAESTLQTSEERFRRALSIDTVGVIFFNPSGKITSANQAFQRMSGYDDHDFAAGHVSWDVLTSPEFLPRAVQALDTLQSTGEVAPHEIQFLRKDGSRWWGLFTAKQLDENECVKFVIDISLRKQAEAALRASKEQMRLLLESVQDYAIFTLDRAGFITSWNEGARRLTGYTADEIIGQPLHIAYTPEAIAAQAADAEMQTALRTGRSEVEGWRVRKDGSRFWGNEIMTPLLADDGSLHGFTKITRDLSLQQQAEEALRASDARQRFLLKFGDRLDKLATATEIAYAASEMLGSFLNVQRVVYFDVDPTEQYTNAWTSWTDGSLPPIQGTYELASYGPEISRLWLEGLPWWVDDIENDARAWVRAGIAGYRSLGIRAVLCPAPLVRGGRKSALITVHSVGPRKWTQDDLNLIEEVTERTWTAIERVHAEETLRQNAAATAYRLVLADALRPLTDPREIQAVAARVLGEHLGASRVHYGEISDPENYAVIYHDYCNGVSSLVGTHDLRDYDRWLLNEYRAGRTVVIPDVASQPGLMEPGHAPLLALGVASFVAVPLVKGGQWVGLLAVHQNQPRNWQAQEVSLVEETAERTWAAVERAYIEEALRVSEANYRATFDSIDEGFCLLEIIFDASGKAVDFIILEANETFERHTSFANAKGKHFRDLVPNGSQQWLDVCASVAQSGNPIRYENHSELLDRWIDANISKVAGSNDNQVAIVLSDVTVRKRRELNIAFVSDVTAAIAQLATPDDISTVVTARLAEYLKVPYSFFIEMDQAQDIAWFYHTYTVDDTVELPATIRLSDFLQPAAFRVLNEGNPLVVRDTQNDPRVNAAACAAADMAAFVSVPYQRFGSSISLLAVIETQPRDWREDEIEVLIDLAHRVFARVETASAEEALRRRAEEFQAHFSLTAVGAAQADVETGRLVLVNRALCEITGYSEAELLERNIWDLTIQSDQLENDRFLDELIRGERDSFETENRVIRKDGSLRWVMVNVTIAQRDSAGRPLRTGAMIMDITERKRIEEALRASEERLRLTMDSIYEYAVITLDENGTIIGWNVGAENIFGYRAEEIIGRSAALLFTPEDRLNGIPALEINQARSTGRAADERWHVRKDQSRFFASGVLSPLQTGGGFVKVARDLTERKEAEEGLRQLNETLESRVEERTQQVRQLVTQLTMSEQEERRRISGILHDDLQQRLFSFNFQLTLLRSMLDNQEEDEARQLIAEIEEHLRESIFVTRNLSVDLSPPVLYNEGILEAIHWLATQMERHYGLNVTVSATANWPRLDEDLRVMLFQIVRELLFNVVKYAEVDNASIILSPIDDSLRIEVSDQGKGFDPKAQRSPHSQGLLRIGQRLQLIGGRMELVSQPGDGTSVTLYVPLYTERTEI